MVDADDRRVEGIRHEGVILGTAFLGISVLAHRLQPTLSETSNWFRAVTVVRIGTSELTLYSLIERNGATAIRTVLRSTGTE